MSARDQLIAEATVAAYVEAGYWGTTTLADVVASHAQHHPDALAIASEHEQITWLEYEQRSDALAALLVQAGLEPGDRVGVFLPDGPAVHIAYLATEKAALTAVGIGPRAGDREVAHLLARTGARTLITLPTHRDRRVNELRASLEHYGTGIDQVVLVSAPPAGVFEVSVDPPVAHASVPVLTDRRLGPNDLFLLNSTSGTTGLPKCVTQFQNRWFYFNQLATDAAGLTSQDVFMSVVPAPFGFGLWTAHFTPAILGAPVVVLERFTPEAMAAHIARFGVTVLACVSTQFVMLLNSRAVADHDLSSLRVMFTGGEAVPEARAAQFEEQTGAKVLQFYGSNETGALTCTTLSDDRHHRLTTAGRAIPEMQVRLVDEHGQDITEPGRPGQPACRGPATCAGYYDDPDANAQLYTPDGWMLMGDICTLDDDGYLQVVGRTSDIIIRGGKNISAVVVEQQVDTHPAVELAAAIPMPDQVFGEKVCVFVELKANTTLTLEDLVAHLRSRDLSPELFPERLEVVDALPRASGGKIAKGELRDRLATMQSAEQS